MGKFKGKLGLGIAAAAILMLVGFIFLKPDQSRSYGVISDLTVSAADTAKSATTTYTISMTVEKAISSSGGQVNIQFYGPSGYSTANGSSSNNINFDNASLSSTSSPSTFYKNYGYSNYISIKTTSSVSAGSTISLVIDNVINPANGGRYFAHVWTDWWGYEMDGTGNWGGDYNSSYVEISSDTGISGTITDAFGTPVPFAQVSVYNYGGNYSYYYAYADKNGKYGIGDVSAGTYTFSIYYSGSYNSGKTYFPPDNSSVTVTSGSTTTKDSSFLAATKTLSGKITKTSADGTPVTNAYVYASKMGGNGWANALADSSGNYSLTLTGGSWYIGIYANTWPADWVYSVYNETVDFVSDTSTETKTKNFITDSVNSTITGKIVKPDGSTPTQWSVGISFSNTKNRYFSSSFDDYGNFTAQVAAGTFSTSGWVSDSNYSFPKVDNFSIGENESKNLGTITLIEKTDTISGTILDNFGSPVVGASVYGWKNDGTYDWANATTGSDGSYILKVVPGTWQVSSYPQWNSGYVYSGEPTSIVVTSGVVSTKNFTYQKATATISGTITDPDGNVINSLYSWVGASDGSREWSNIGTSIEKGSFTLKVPAGTWELNVYIYGADYSSPDPLTVTIADYESKAVSMQAVRNDATLQGTIYDDQGNKITSTWMSIYATKGKNGSWRSANFDQSTGTYSISVSAGTWNLGWWIDKNTGYSSGASQDIEQTIASGETKVYDIVLKRADSTISGKALKSDGSTMQWAWITADSRDPNEKKTSNRYYDSNGSSSNANGDYELKVPAGTYWVGGSMWAGSGWINPKRQKVTVDANNPASLDLTFRTANATITGTVKNGGATSAFISAWAEDGGYSEANANNEGSYTVNVSSGTKWHVKAMKQIDQDVYKSQEYIVDVNSSTSFSLDIQLEKQDFTLPATQTITFDPTKQQTISLDDDTVVSIPANTIATSGQITLTIEANANLAEEADAKPLDYGYDINATDQNGQEIVAFNGNVTIEDTYTEATLTDQKVLDEDELVAAYYDEAVGTWEELPSCTVNSEEDSVTYQTNHFTKFALVSATDSTPPNTPTSVSASAGDTKATISWTNSSNEDLAGVKVYRSTESGTLGDLVTTTTGTTTSYENTGLTNDTTYYYTLRSYDTSGNLSSNSTQVSAKPAGSASSTATQLPATGKTPLITWILLTLSTLLITYIGIKKIRVQRARGF